MKVSKLTDKQIKQELKELRKFIDETDDLFVSRIAYSIETAVRYVTQDTEWKDDLKYNLIKEAVDTAEMIRNDK